MPKIKRFLPRIFYGEPVLSTFLKYQLSTAVLSTKYWFSAKSQFYPFFEIFYTIITRLNSEEFLRSWAQWVSLNQKPFFSKKISTVEKFSEFTLIIINVIYQFLVSGSLLLRFQFIVVTFASCGRSPSLLIILIIMFLKLMSSKLVCHCW